MAIKLLTFSAEFGIISPCFSARLQSNQVANSSRREVNANDKRRSNRRGGQRCQPQQESSRRGCGRNLRGHRPRHQKEQTVSGTRIRNLHGTLTQSTQGKKSSD